MSAASARATIARLSQRWRLRYRSGLESPTRHGADTMRTRSMTTTLLPALALLSLGAAGVASAAGQSVSLTQDPLVMRLSKDEFRIVFGIHAQQRAGRG